MRTFYIYNINDLLCSLYDQYPHKLYLMLEEIYYTNKYETTRNPRLYDQIITNFNKLYINNYLIANNKLDAYYYNKCNMRYV